MSRHRLPLATLVALVSAGVLLASGCGGGATIPPNAVAVVDGGNISRSSLDALLEQQKQQYKRQTPPQAFPQAGTSEYQALQQRTVSYLVLEQEYTTEAKKQFNITVSDADVDKSIADVEKKYFGGDKKKFEAALKKQGTTLAQYRETVPRQVLITKLTAAITKDVTATPAEAKAYYDKNKSSATYTTPKSRLMRHILVKTLPEANKIYAQLAAGADFATLEKKHSLDTATNKAGGTFTVSTGQTVPEYEAAAFSLKTGTVSKPVHSKQYGYFIIKPIGDLKPAHTKSFAEVSKDINTTLLSQKKNDALTAWAKNVTKLYKGKVKYAVGFEPPAAATTPSTTTG